MLMAQRKEELVDLPPDLKETKKFLKLVVGDSEQICFQTFAEKPGSKATAQIKYGPIKEMSDWLTAENNRGAGAFFCVNRTDGPKRSSENVVAVRAVFVDLDGSPVEPVLNCKVPPSVVIESSPGRYQAFWRCSHVAVSEFTQMQKALIAKFNGDKAIKDLGRVMRLAGFWHQKGSPHLVRMIYKGSGFKYTKEKLIEELELKVDWLDEHPAFEGGDIAGPAVHQGKRHEEMKILSIKLRRSGLSGYRLHKAVMAENDARCLPPLTESEVAKLTGWANKHVNEVNQRIDTELMQASVREDFRRTISIVDGNELKAMKLPEVKWIIRDLLPQGLCILAGAPKVGKSWLAQQLGLSVATGGMACDTFQCNKGQVLHLALEDTSARIQSRMLFLLRGQANAIDLRGYHSTTAWDTLPEAITRMEAWITAQDSPRMIIVDTFQKIRAIGRKNDDSIYAKDYLDVGQLHYLAARYGISVLVVHHKRKQQADDPMGGVSGSTGVTGAADSIWLFDRPDRMEMVGQLQISGRDVSDRQYYFKWSEKQDLFGWHFAGDGEKYEQSEAEERFLGCLMDAGRPLGCAEISETSGISRRHAFRLSDTFREKQYIERSAGQHGKYIITQAGEDALKSLMKLRMEL